MRLAPTVEPTEPAVEDLVWRYMSVEEVVIDGSSVKLEWADATAADTNDQITFTQEEIFLIRVWSRQQRRRGDAPSPTRASIPVRRELVGLTLNNSASPEYLRPVASVAVMMQIGRTRRREGVGQCAAECAGGVHK